MLECAQRFQLGAEPKRVAVPSVIQRLDPQAVAQQIKLLVGFRPQGYGEHPDEATYCAGSPLGERFDDHLGITRPDKNVAQCFQLFANFAKVVDLAVENHHPAAVPRSHGLMAERRQVKDRQPGVAQPDAALEPQASVVRATMM